MMIIKTIVCCAAAILLILRCITNTFGAQPWTCEMEKVIRRLFAPFAGKPPAAP